MTDPLPQDENAPPLTVGDVILAVFPRMAGKARPGVILATGRDAVLAAPCSTRRTRQPHRLETPRPAAFGFDKRSQILLPAACLLPRRRVLERRGALAAAERSALMAATAACFGPGWESADPGLARGVRTPRPYAGRPLRRPLPARRATPPRA